MASSSDGTSAAIANYSASALTLVLAGEVRSYKLPWEGLRIEGLALNDRWIVLDEIAENRLLIFRREALVGFERELTLRLAACR